jgi:hypothetical protein
MAMTLPSSNLDKVASHDSLDHALLVNGPDKTRCVRHDWVNLETVANLIRQYEVLQGLEVGRMHRKRETQLRHKIQPFR